MTQKLISINLGAVRAQLEKKGQEARTSLENSRKSLLATALRTGNQAVSRLADLGTKASTSQLALFKELKRKTSVS